jgi:multicomponent Na+:H+ antiporter subunit B
MKRVTLVALLLFAGLILYGVGNIPERASPAAPPNAAQSAAGTPNAATYYVENAYTDADTPNMVTVTLADYRGFDTLGETTVIFAAGLACALILRARRRPE